jgi:hypothetical protein
MNSDRIAALSTALEPLEALRHYADDACQAAYRANIKGAINWGDLGCTEASLSVNEFDEPQVSVLIEEADPICPELQRFVAEYLDNRGYAVVIVFTEW